jgi:UDP-N-acetylmuramyl tripeptide synthase
MQDDLSERQLTKVTTVVDRGVAIGQAIADASSDDIVLIAGKGHENTQEIHGVKQVFSDIEFVEKLFKENT